MQGDLPKTFGSATTSFQSRFNDTPLAFSMKRYEHKADDCIWFFSVRRYCGGEDLIRIEASEKALREMRDYIDRALGQIQADRSPSPTEGDGNG
jgi:hypothetical protein